MSALRVTLGTIIVILQNRAILVSLLFPRWPPWWFRALSLEAPHGAY